jgi:hypothetical protein
MTARAARGERRYHPVHRGHRLEEEATVMARIKHIALTMQNPDKVAAFYKDAVGILIHPRLQVSP